MVDNRQQGKGHTDDDLPREVAEAFSADLSEETEARLRGVLAGFRRDLAGHRYVRRSERRGRPGWGFGGGLRRVVQPAMLAAAVAACIVLVVMLSVGPATPTWAQVTERFASVKTFNLTFYRREDALSDVRQVELWMASGGRVRLKTGSQVVFAHKGKATKAFDVQKRKEVEADRMAMYLLLPLGNRETFSLDVVVELFSGGKLKEVTPQVNPGAALGRDMVVYDMQSPRTPEWCRIWALRDSRLPVRIQVWDPRDGEYSEAIFTYGPEPAAAFFDAELFAKRLADRAISSRTLSYLGLDDAVGKTFVPEVPESTEALGVVTKTLDGDPWSLKERMGKITVLHIWNPQEGGPAGIMHDRRDLMPLQEKYGQREDFQIVSLAVFEDPARLREMIARQQVPWPILHDPKGWDGELVRTLGGPQHTAIYLVDRWGHITKTEDTRDMEAELVGPTYDNWFPLRRRFYDKIRAGTMTTEMVQEVFGQPNERKPSTQDPNREQWIYVRYDDLREREARITVEVDRGKGIATGLSPSRRILEPATLTVTVTPEYWKTKVLPQVKSEYRPENDHDDAYRIALCVRIRDADRDLGGSAMWDPDFVPGTHSVKLRHGTGQLVVRVRERKGRKTQRLVIKDNILLEKNKTTEIKLK